MMTETDRLVTDGGSDFDPSDLDVSEPPEEPDPPMYAEWEDVETWMKGSLRYPVPGGWDLDDHGKFHTTWVHDDGAKLTRSWKSTTPGPKDTFAFNLNGEEIHRVETGPQRVEMREETVWVLTFYDENEVDSPESFKQQVREEQNASLEDFA